MKKFEENLQETKKELVEIFESYSIYVYIYELI